MLISTHVFHRAGVAITDREAVSRMAGALAELAGPAGFYIYSIGFWAAVLASPVGFCQTIPSVFADCYGLLRRLPADQREAAARAGAPAYRMALGFMALASVPFTFSAARWRSSSRSRFWAAFSFPFSPSPCSI